MLCVIPIFTHGSMIKIRITLLFLFLLILGSYYSQLPCGQSINFNTWTQEGASSSGQWNVTASGDAVEQNINGTGTWFVSPNDFFNVLIQGSIQINTANDDDLVGFVFGYQSPFGSLTSPTNTYVKSFVFDWKQSTQNFMGLTSFEGFALYEVDGLFDFTNIVGSGGGVVYPELWERVNSPTVTVLDTDYGNNGWNDFQQYNFQLKYTADSIIIWIDGNKIFEETGCFEPGRFGFYNHSQDNVIYSNFSYTFDYDFSINDTIICINDVADFLIGSGCLNYFPASTTFDWDFGDGNTHQGINPSHQYSAPGLYNVQLLSVDSLGCSSSAVHSLEVLPPLSINAGVNDTICGLTYQLNANTTSSGNWTGSSGVLFDEPNSPISYVTVSSPGLYTFTWTAYNAEGCTYSDSVSILFDTLTLSSSILSPTCYNEHNGEISISPTGGQPPYSFQWDNNANNQTTNPATSLSAGSYSVSVTDLLGCSVDSTFQLTAPSQFNFSVSITPSECHISNGVISIDNLNGGSPPYYFDWGNGFNTNSISSNLINGSYSVTIQDNNGCDTTINAVIPTNSFTAQVDSIRHVSCYGAANGVISVSGPVSTETYTYTWSNLSGNPTTHTVSDVTSGIYNVIVSSTDGRCSDTLQIIINEPQPMVLVTSPDTIICQTMTVPLYSSASGGTPPYTYLWDNNLGNGSSHTVSPDHTTIYQVTAIDNNGCSESDSSIIFIVPTPDIVFSVDITVQCFSPNNQFIFYNQTPHTTTTNWNFGDLSGGTGDTTLHSYSTPGIYSVTLTVVDTNGCFSSKTDTNMVRVVANPVANFEMTPNPVSILPPTVHFIDLSEGNQINSWNWYYDTTFFSQEKNPKHTFSDAVNQYMIQLIIEDLFGCKDSITKQLFVEESVSIYAPNTFTPDANKFNETWQIYADGIDSNTVKIQLFNRWGEIIWESNNINIPWDGTYAGTPVPDGTYIWTLQVKSNSSDKVYQLTGHVNVLR